MKLCRIFGEGNNMENSIDAKFVDIIKSKTGCAVILAGSSSDEKYILDLSTSLSKYHIPFQVRICSAHKQALKLIDIVHTYDSFGGSLAYIAVADGTDALSGTGSFYSLNPFITSPPGKFNDSHLSNPPGSPNALILHPANVAKFIAQMYSGVNPTFKELLQKYNDEKIASLEESDAELSKRLSKYSYGT